MSSINIYLNTDRTLGGIIEVIKSNGSQEGYGLSALGKAAVNDAIAHDNPTASQFALYGDTPTGTYSIIEITKGIYHNNSHSYGPNGVIKIQPVSGNAEIAASNGRVGLLIHGGELGTGGKLRRTNGCIRLRNDEYLYLKNIIEQLSIGDPVDVVRVFESDASSGSDASNDTCGDDDPPPDF